MAPEYAMRGQFSTKADVFSYGIIVLEILTGRTIYCIPGQTDEDLLSYVRLCTLDFFIWELLFVLVWISGIMNSPESRYFVHQVWHHWSKGEPLEAIDKSISGVCPSQMLIRCIHIALLCVQEDPSERPDMATVIFMLRSQSMTLPAPTTPRVLFLNSTTYSQVPLSEK
jgi:serine/threonine protein kinase